MIISPDIILKVFFIAKDLFKTNVTISIENKCSYSLINPITYLNCGDSVNPADPIIYPKKESECAA
jgi:hypothetical protein